MPDWPSPEGERDPCRLRAASPVEELDRPPVLPGALPDDAVPPGDVPSEDEPEEGLIGDGLAGIELDGLPAVLVGDLLPVPDDALSNEAT